MNGQNLMGCSPFDCGLARYAQGERGFASACKRPEPLVR